MSESEWQTRKQRIDARLADQLELQLAKARGQVDALTPSLLALPPRPRLRRQTRAAESER